MRSNADRIKHISLIEELVDLFLEQGFKINGADGVEGYFPPIELHNDGYGDQEDKMPDIYAYDSHSRRYIIGEAKTGQKDFESEHSLTQYSVYCDQINPITGTQAVIYFIVPANRVTEFTSILTRYLHPELIGNIVVVQSQRWTD